jgi:outer membrane protein assembly factor BamD
MGVDAEPALMRRLALGLALVAVGCHHHGTADIATLSSNSDRVIFEAGQKAFAKREWDPARQHFKRIIDGFPQSPYGPDSRIGLGDAYFREGGIGNWILAVSAYRDFLTLYPSSPKSDYAQFQVAESFFQQRNGPDRDPTQIMKALTEFQKLLETYPASSYTEPARTRIRECRQSLAQSEYTAGYFYQRTRKAYRAAVSRYDGLLADYPDYDKLDLVLYRLAQCLVLSGRKVEALPHLDRLIAEYPRSQWANDAQKLLAQLKKDGVAPPPPPPPQPSGPPGGAP